MAGGKNFMISDSEKSALYKAVQNYILYKTHGVREMYLLDVKVDEETKDLESFLSMVKRVKVSYRKYDDSEIHFVSFIVKKIPVDGFQSLIIKSCRALEREKAFYKYFFPVAGTMVQRLRHSELVEDNFQVPFPDFLFASNGEDGEAEYIILEDLCARGYRLPRCNTKVQGLNLDHCLIAMRVLGKFHALMKVLASIFTCHPVRRLHTFGGLLGRFADLYRSGLHWIIRQLKRYKRLYRVAFVAENFLSPADYALGAVSRTIPELGRDAMWYDSNREPSIFYDVVKKRAEVILCIAKQLDGLPKKAEESGLLGRELEKVWAMLIRFASPSRTGWNVVNHGDCWINNMLFSYHMDVDGIEKPEDMMFIDFQFSRYCHPVIDLLYLLYTSTCRSFRDLHFDLLVSKYHASLVETLVSLEPMPISLDELKFDLRGEYQPFGVIIGTFFAPYLKLEVEETNSCGDSVTKDAYESFIKDGNSSAALRQFHHDSKFRSFMEDNVRELTDVIFPNGDLGRVNPYWI